MNAEQIVEWEAILLAVIMWGLTIVIALIISNIFRGSLLPSPEVIYYFQNCNNLTLYPQGCQVLS
jgi:hypothetical protein